MRAPLRSEQQAILPVENNKKKTTCTGIAAAGRKKAAPALAAGGADSIFNQSDIGAPGVLLL